MPIRKVKQTRGGIVIANPCGTVYEVSCPCCLEKIHVNNTYNEAQSNLYHCDVCKKDVCIDCIIFSPHNMTRGMHKKMLVDRLSGRDACEHCIEKTELEYIQELPIEEVPFLISWEWISKTAHQAYKRRLAAGK